MSYRIEKDSMGELKVPKDALYGAQTQRAIDNFPISGITMPEKFIHAVVLIKQTAAKVNLALGLLEPDIATAIFAAGTNILEGDYAHHFPVDVFQTGSGTSTNMNVNEVIANLASRQTSKTIDPNDHVNMGQSSNDVIPTAIHLSTAIGINQQLIPALEHLVDCIETKMTEVSGITKTGRTHLMDAMPITLEQELSAWAKQIQTGIERLISTQSRLHKLAQGGTAVGTGINAHPKFAISFAAELSKNTGIDFQINENLFSAIASQDTAVEVSGCLKTLAVSLMKIANDLRWMNSGPLAGLAEIQLPARQPGSSIMPGKVNPVIPEAVAMVAAQVIGNDTTITIAGQSGNFQLNVMLPVIAFNLLQNIELLSTASKVLAEKAITSFTVNHANIAKNLARNPILVTALNPLIGYLKAAEIAKTAYENKRSILDVASEMTNIPREELEKLLNPQRLTNL